MGTASIISEDGDGEYSVSLDYGQEVITGLITDIDTRLVILASDQVELQNAIQGAYLAEAVKLSDMNATL